MIQDFKKISSGRADLSSKFSRAGPTRSQNSPGPGRADSGRKFFRAGPGRLGPKILPGRAGPAWAENSSGPEISNTGLSYGPNINGIYNYSATPMNVE